jgi:hypothetical protein
VGCNNIDTEWDDDYPGLVETLAREAEWKRQEAHDDAAAASWEVNPPDGWGNTPPASPIWPGASIDEYCSTWPSPSAVVPTGTDSWPNLSASIEGGIKVTIEMVIDIRESQEGHTACRF